MKITVHRDVARAATEITMALGAMVEFKPGKKHTKLVVSKGDQQRTVTVTPAPRTGIPNQVDWVRQDIRRIVRELDQ